jgi:YHS domain-containing protein
LLFLLVLRAISRFLSGVVDGATTPADGQRSLNRGVQMARDPVCGTFIVPSNALMVVEGSRAAYFCSERCRDAYRAEAKTRPRA